MEMVKSGTFIASRAVTAEVRSSVVTAGVPVTRMMVVAVPSSEETREAAVFRPQAGQEAEAVLGLPGTLPWTPSLLAVVMTVGSRLSLASWP